jgi:hypothetical protein
MIASHFKNLVQHFHASSSGDWDIVKVLIVTLLGHGV